MTHTVAVTLTDGEYKQAVETAKSLGITLAQYVKQNAIVSDDFTKYFDILCEKAKRHPLEKPFMVMDLFADWDAIDRGLRLSLGRTFYHQVSAGKIPGIALAGKGRSNIQLYVRIAE